MPLAATGDILYRRKLFAGVRLQVDPPVCNACEGFVTPGNLGKTYLDRPTPDGPAGLYELIECATCAGYHAGQRVREQFALTHPRTGA